MAFWRNNRSNVLNQNRTGAARMSRQLSLSLNKKRMANQAFEVIGDPGSPQPQRRRSAAEKLTKEPLDAHKPLGYTYAYTNEDAYVWIMTMSGNFELN